MGSCPTIYFIVVNVFLLLFILLNPVQSYYSGYLLNANYSGTTFFNNFWFFNQSDPTNGYVDYVNAQDAFAWGYVKAQDPVYIGCDSWSISSGRGRGSVRIQSYQSWTQGLFLIDLQHMPTGCGTWPAFWLCGSDWPNNGEIDIIEGVNIQTNDQTTLHTSDGCDQSGEWPGSFTGSWAKGTNGNNATNCYVDAPYQGENQGCSIESNIQNFGASFNSLGGGVYATLWNDSNIATWFFPRGNIPSDITSGHPNPSSWGLPYARFELGANCPISHFSEMNIIINLTFCGDWAGNVFPEQCPNDSNGNCVAYVQNNPSAFTQAYWLINYVAVYQNPAF